MLSSQRSVPPIQNGAKKISLDGTWRLSGFDPQQPEKKYELKAIVPGHVHGDLLRNGMIVDPFWRDQADQCQWVEKCYWTYEREFNLDGLDLQYQKIRLECQGLEVYCQIQINGQFVARTDNMFIPHVFDVAPYLKEGENRILLKFTPDAVMHADKDFSKYFACFAEDRVYSRRTQCRYGWDWTHRLVGAGIWRPVALVGYNTARLTDVFVDTKGLEAGKATLEIQHEIEAWDGRDLELSLELLDPSGQAVWTQSQTVQAPGCKQELVLDHPQVWFPNGFGAHPLYALKSVLMRRDDRCVLDEKRTQFGVRTVQIEEIPDEQGASFTLKVNGERIFCKGGNWVPADPFPSTIQAEHYERLIELAQRSNMNLLRVWGGGIYEDEAFWDACDRRGVMVSQDFLLACADYPEDDENFMAQLRVEFEQAIRLLRNHPSLAFWSGNNELAMNSDPATQFSGKKISDQISGPLCRRLDPSRPYRPTSPFGGNPNNNPMEGDCHVSAWYDGAFLRSDMTDYQQRIDQLQGRFLSEAAICGAPPLHVLLKFMTRDDLNDPSWAIFEYHTNDNPYNDIPEMTHLQLLRKTARQLFGPAATIEREIAQMEYVHYEWIRLTTESLRRKKFQQCSGVQWWMYNDNWPASGWSVVDYWGFAKAGYYACKNSFQPVIVSVERSPGDYGFWICNDSLEKAEGVLKISEMAWNGGVGFSREIKFSVASNQSQKVASVESGALPKVVAREAMLLAQIEGNFENYRTWRFEGAPSAMNFPPATLGVERTMHKNSGELRIRTDRYARVVTLAGDFDFEDNYFDLLPGEERVIRWRATPASRNDSIAVSCWNANHGPIIVKTAE